LLGLGCIGVRRWARIGGICFCLLALLCSYLWFMDQSNSDVSRVVFAINLLTPPFALGALSYLLFGWPNKVIHQNIGGEEIQTPVT
jgi:drug/metabolite transporter (DMT)-like permease